jgi:hypothetical protein
MLFQLQYPDSVLAYLPDFTFWLSPKSKHEEGISEPKAA